MYANSKRPPSAGSVVRNTQQQDLTLFGEGALAARSRPASVLKDGFFYPPNYPVNPQSPDRGSTSPYSVASHGACAKSPTRLQVGSHGTYFMPANSPVDLGNKGSDGDYYPYLPQSRSLLDRERPVSEHITRYASEQSGLTRGRPKSRHSEVESRFDYSRAYSSFSDYSDPDHEPISDVLTRLGDYTQTFNPGISLANTECECQSHDQRVPSRLAKLYDSDQEDSSDSDDEGVTVDTMLKTFQQYEDKGHSSVRQKAMLTLLQGFSGEEMLTQENTEKLFWFLKSSLPQVQDACLLLLKLCAKVPENVKLLLDYNILEYLLSFLESHESSPFIKSALLLLEVIISQHVFKDSWLEVILTKFVPELLKHLRGEYPLDVKYTACCVFRALAHYEEFIVHITDVILPTIIMMRNSSAKFKEVYVEILTTILANTDLVPPDLVDSSAIPITGSIIREGPCGPQYAALQLLSSLTTVDTGVAMVIGTGGLVPMILCCMKESHCRKVRLNATQVMGNLSATRKIGLCKDLMLQLSVYFVPDLDKDSLTSLSLMADPQKVPMSNKPRFDEDRRMWQGLEKFIEMTKEVIYREAKVEVDELDTVTKIHMKPGIDVCPIQLAVLSHSLHILQSMCLWPLDKSRLGFSANKIDLTSFTDDMKQMARLSKVNRGLTQAIWDKTGTIVSELLSSYASNFTKSCAQTDVRKSPVSLNSVFEVQEISLILSMLELLLCTAICTCTAFPEILPSKQEKQSKSTKLKSSSSPQFQYDSKSSPTETRLKSQSDSNNSMHDDGDRFWVRENPHLTNIRGTSNKDGASDGSKAELKHKEACTERRLLRKCLYEAGVFHCICPFLMCSDGHVQVLVLQTLRCLIQPLEERVAPQPPKMVSYTASGSSSTRPRQSYRVCSFKIKTALEERVAPQPPKMVSYTASGSSSTRLRQRPQSAFCAREKGRKLNIALYNMSPELAGLIKEALGPRADLPAEDTKSSRSTLEIPGQPWGLETIQERLQEYTENLVEEGVSMDEPSAEKREERLRKPLIDRCRPIAQQCRELLLEEVGDILVRGIFNRSKVMKKQCVLLLHDLVQHGEVSTHMKLSEHGCMPKLVDYLRVNEDDELLEIIGLIIVRLLVKSDSRLKQLFNRHGGPPLLIAMAQYTKGLLKQEVSTTLKTVSKVDTAPMKKRPMSAPVARTTNRLPDIWDNIQARWKQEDQVQNVLRQWMQQ